MIAIITITDSADGKKCSVDVQFDPPYQKAEPHTPATLATLIALSAIQGEASGWKQTLIITKDDENKAS